MYFLNNRVRFKYPHTSVDVGEILLQIGADLFRAELKIWRKLFKTAVTFEQIDFSSKFQNRFRITAT